MNPINRVAFARLIGFIPFSAMASHQVFFLMEPRFRPMCDLQFYPPSTFTACVVAVLLVLSGTTRENRHFLGLLAITAMTIGFGHLMVTSMPPGPNAFCEGGGPPIRMAQDLKTARSFSIATFVASATAFACISAPSLVALLKARSKPHDSKSLT